MDLRGSAVNYVEVNSNDFNFYYYNCYFKFYLFLYFLSISPPPKKVSLQIRDLISFFAGHPLERQTSNKSSQTHVVIKKQFQKTNFSLA